MKIATFRSPTLRCHVPHPRLAVTATIACLLLASPALAAPRPATLLDEFMPSCHFRNAESVRIHAPPWAMGG